MQIHLEKRNIVEPLVTNTSLIWKVRNPCIPTKLPHIIIKKTKTEKERKEKKRKEGLTYGFILKHFNNTALIGVKGRFQILCYKTSNG